MISADQNQSWISQHAALATAPNWLMQQRQQALTHFETVGLPGVRDEQWRYTNLRALKSQQFSVGQAVELSQTLPSVTHARLVIVDGFVDLAASTLPSMQGVTVNRLSDVWQDASVQEAFGTTLPSEQHGFTALNTAYAQDGYVLQLSQGAVVEMLEIVFINQHSQAVSHARNLIIAAANSQCTVVERHCVSSDANDDMTYLSNTLTEIIAGDNAHIDHYKIQQHGDSAFHMGGVFINQARSSQVKSHNIALSGLVTRNDIHSNLQGSGAHIEMNGLVLGQGRQHIDNHTQVNHLEPSCSSDEYYKTVLSDHSRSVFRGRIVVAQDAQLTIADQQNNNLLLSGNAEADTKPQLEIYADDVKCSHGATVGQLDPKSVFYLKSRGINSEQANALLTFAFANQVIERVGVSAIREELTQIMAGELLAGLEELV
ncbi:Fe-S cluster assembly protein SufD [Arenicella xantha]|uniref:Iron-regulated ABC transporter permease protein SufD n=1 Tax=Arenicella xantha TaxID=644221 RepID=A0A395JPR1_9GAMM|nr:Fe-S cluster assembly protein SufD [Arenicella xantha]RBP53631.1 iron-regulated ABC transporter permease protein SufD [Arenicella xantha]